MSNDLTGTQGSSNIYPPSSTTDSSSLITGDTTITKSTSVDAQVYDGTDTMGVGVESLQNFAVNHKKEAIYQAYEPNPELVQPDEEGMTGPQPYGVAQQKLIIRSFHKHVRELIRTAGLSTEDAKLVYNAIVSGTPLADPKLANIAKDIGNQAKAETRKEARLPESWDPTKPEREQTRQDWTVQPYNSEEQAKINQAYDEALQKNLSKYIEENKSSLTDTEIAQLKQAVETGKVPSAIADIFVELTSTATKEIQKTYRLPDTWHKGIDPKSDAWRPVNLDIVNPTAVNQTQAEMVLDNVTQLLTDLDEIGKKVAAELETIGGTNAITMDEYRRVIAQAIKDLKKMLRDIQVADAERSKQSFQAKQDAIKAKQDDYERQVKKQEEMEAKQKKGEKINLAMKICGPIVAALGTLVGAALLIFTFGTSTALIVASIAVGVAMTAYSIVDSATGCTQKLMEVINNALEKAYPDNPLTQKLIKFACLAAVAIFLIAVIVLTGGGALGSVVSSTAGKIALEVVKQFAIQALIMAIMSSNAIPELVVEIAKEKGMSEEDSQTLQIIMMILTAIAVMVAIAKGTGGAASASATKTTAQVGIVEGIKSGLRSVQQAFNRTMDALRKMMDTIQELTVETLKTVQKLCQQLMRSLVQLKNAIAELPETLTQAARNSIQQMKQTVEELQALLKDPTKAIDAIKNTAQKLEEVGQKLMKELDELLAEVSQTVSRGKEIALEELKAALDKLTELTKAALKTLAQSAKDTKEGVLDIGRGFGKVKDLVQDFRAGKPLNPENMRQVLGSTQKTLQLTSLSINVADGITRGVIALQVAKLLEEVGETKEAQEIIQATIKLLQKILDSLQTGMDDRAEFLTSLNQALDSFYEGLSQMTTNIMVKTFQA
jgi:hypothetical protein